MVTALESSGQSKIAHSSVKGYWISSGIRRFSDATDYVLRNAYIIQTHLTVFLLQKVLGRQTKLRHLISHQMVALREWGRKAPFLSRATGT